ncbi:MAG: tRNA pseudouridine synthase D [Candidatus Bathyarchaeota archaeon B63]|nr:MAG: tRNA pseudouridine synthase D [Candidatus Bathyarchaeota archaeon B63]
MGALRRLPLRLRRLFIQAYQSYLFNRFLSERMKREIPLTRIQIGDYLMSIGEEGLPTGRFLEVEENNPHWASSMLREGKAALALPLVGFDQKLSGGLQGEIEREILEKEGIQPRDFKVEKMLEASVRGGLRRALAPVMNFKFVTMPGDEGSVAKFSFMLHRGTYATVVMREFLKPSDPAEQGF